MRMVFSGILGEKGAVHERSDQNGGDSEVSHAFPRAHDRACPWPAMML